MRGDLGAARPRGWSEPGRTTLELRTGGWRTHRPQYVEATAPCRPACPAREPIARWIERARAGDWAGAWALIREENPLPAVTGRVCAHPCESACNRRAWDGAVAINALEQFVGDWGLLYGTASRTAGTRRERIAVAGGGPSGLACAYHLARLGYGVTVVEREAELGGLLRYGIPEYRLPRAVLDRELELIVALGVEVMTGQAVGPGFAWAEAGYDALYLATGAQVPLRLAVPGAEGDHVGDGLAFLRAVNSGVEPALGRRLVVVGGGSTAMDVARTARRLGVPSVTVLALEDRGAMPAIPDEVEQAEAEGVLIRNGLGVTAFWLEAGVLAGVVATPAHAERAPSGAIRPVFHAASPQGIEADRVLLAIGQEPDLGNLPPGLGVEDGIVLLDAHGRTGTPRVFAGGDLASRQRTVAHAIGAGTRAARAIHRALAGAASAPATEPRAAAARLDHTVEPSVIATHAFPPSRRAVRWERLPGLRVTSFVEVTEGLGEHAARAEAERCFTCGRCVLCDICLRVCPDMAIVRDDGGYRVSTDHCKGCGLCARECPRGALEMVEER